MPKGDTGSNSARAGEQAAFHTDTTSPRAKRAKHIFEIQKLPAPLDLDKAPEPAPSPTKQQEIKTLTTETANRSSYDKGKAPLDSGAGEGTSTQGQEQDHIKPEDQAKQLYLQQWDQDLLRYNREQWLQFQQVEQICAQELHTFQLAEQTLNEQWHQLQQREMTLQQELHELSNQTQELQRSEQPSEANRQDLLPKWLDITSRQKPIEDNKNLLRKKLYNISRNKAKVIEIIAGTRGVKMEHLKKHLEEQNEILAKELESYQRDIKAWDSACNKLDALKLKKVKDAFEYADKLKIIINTIHYEKKDALLNYGNQVFQELRKAQDPKEFIDRLSSREKELVILGHGDNLFQESHRLQDDEKNAETHYKQYEGLLKELRHEASENYNEYRETLEQRRKILEKHFKVLDKEREALNQRIKMLDPTKQSVNSHEGEAYQRNERAEERYKQLKHTTNELSEAYSTLYDISKNKQEFLQKSFENAKLAKILLEESLLENKEPNNINIYDSILRDGKSILQIETKIKKYEINLQAASNTLEEREKILHNEYKKLLWRTKYLQELSDASKKVQLQADIDAWNAGIEMSKMYQQDWQQEL